MNKNLIRLVIRNLKLSNKRIIAIMIGIILSTVMICTVAGIFFSLQQTAIQHTIEADGDYHAIFYDVPKEDQKYILENRNVDSYFVIQSVGYAELKENITDNKSYLQLKEFDEKALNNFGINLTEGRLPENNNELIISERVKANTKNFYNVGDKIKLELTSIYPNESEKILDVNEIKEFMIVGIMKVPNLQVDRESQSGYTVITKLDKKSNIVSIAVKLKDIRNIRNIDDWMLKYKFEKNLELLKWSGIFEQNYFMNKVLILVVIVGGIIVIASIFIIKNSFEMSLAEKIQRHGILTSIGATKKQIKKCEILEGLVLGMISIPIGILLGVLITYILVQITTELIGKVAFQNPIVCAFYMPFSSIMISVILEFITIYISCLLSVRKANKINPIMAIKNTTELTIKEKNVKRVPIIKKLFKIEGEITYKNLKINKNRYRTIVFSLILSISMFISIFTFVYYSVEVNRIRNYNINISTRHTDLNNKEVKNFYGYFRDISREFDLEKYTIKRTTYMYTNLEDKMTEEFKKIYLQNYEEKWREMGMMIKLTSLGETEYRDYIEKIDGDYEEYKDGIIYCDNSKTFDEQEQQLKVFDFAIQDTVNGVIKETQENFNLKIVAITKELPMSLEKKSAYGTFIISDKVMDSIGNFECDSMQINAENANKLCEQIEQKYEKTNNVSFNISNYQKEIDSQNGKVLLISIFLYGFVGIITLITITNIFNTISTNMNLRNKEFAILKSMGMSKEQFYKMLNLESILYGFKSLVIGSIIGTVVSIGIYNVINKNTASIDLDFVFPIKPIIICVLFVVFIVNINMRYSLRKINELNIIETIREENI